MKVSNTYKALNNVMGKIRDEIKNLNLEETQEFFEDLFFYIKDESDLY
jgi:hypothetical protein